MPPVEVDLEDAWAAEPPLRFHGHESEGAVELVPQQGMMRNPALEATSSKSAYNLVRQGNFIEALAALDRCPGAWKEADAEGHTLLHWGALAGNLAFVTKGMEAGAEADARAGNGQSPLMWSLTKGHLPVARKLLQAKADPYAQDSVLATPLIIAVQHGHAGGIVLLNTFASKDGLVEQVDSNGCGAVHWASYKGDLQSLKLLQYFDAHFDIVDSIKMTPLHRAVQGLQPSVLEFLLDRQVDPAAMDSMGRTFLVMADEHQDKSLSRMIKSLMIADRRVPRDGEVGDIESAQKVLDMRKQQNDELAKFTKKASRYVFACFWLMCVSLAVFEYVTEQRHISWISNPRASLVFELGVPLSLILFLVVHLSDPGKVAVKPKTASGVEELMRDFKDKPDTDFPDFNRLCTTTWIIKGHRMKYCKETGACVDEFDHFCGWLNVAIGKGNHRPFMFLAMIEATTQLCHLYICVMVALELIKKPSWSEWLWEALTSYPLLTLVTVVHGFTGPGILMLTLQQLRMVATNITTNEMMNAYRYRHFWIEANGKKEYNNPFDKGSCLMNCLDFWWLRRRTVRGDAPSGCKQNCCKDH